MANMSLVCEYANLDRDAWPSYVSYTGFEKVSPADGRRWVSSSPEANAALRPLIGGPLRDKWYRCDSALQCCRTLGDYCPGGDVASVERVVWDGTAGL